MLTRKRPALPTRSQQKLADKAAKAWVKAEAARALAIEKANEADLEPQGLESQPADAMPYRGLAHRAAASPTAKSQRNHRCAEGCAYTDPDSHIVKSDGNVLQGYNCQKVVDDHHQVIVAMGVSNQPPDVEHLVPMLERTIANTSQAPKTLIAEPHLLRSSRAGWPASCVRRKERRSTPDAKRSWSRCLVRPRKGEA